MDDPVDPLFQNSMADLVAIYNALGPTTPATAKTFPSREKIIKRIRELRYQKTGTLGEWNAEAAKSDPPTIERPNIVLEQLTETTASIPKIAEMTGNASVDVVRSVDAKPRSGRLVRVATEDLLLHVEHVQNGRNVGLAYNEILRQIKSEFPEGKTSIACVRWYATHMRERGENLPIRPRSLPVTK